MAFRRITAGVVALLVTALAGFASHEAQALPSFARQTGQPCSACHTALPELTPFGRAFKLGGYTLGGGMMDPFSHFAGMVQTGFTHTQAPQSGLDPFKPNDNLAIQQASLFYGGKIIDNLGAFVQATYDGIGKSASWDNLDVRLAGSTTIAGKDAILGITVNNNPTVQDAWNTVPAWSFPGGFITSGLGPAPAASTMIEGAFSQQVLGASAYLYYNSMLYAEFGGYQSLSTQALSTLGVAPDGTSAISGVAPYARVAFEPQWGNNSLEVGAFGMFANVVPQRTGTQTDSYTDLGLDAQYQYINDKNAFSVNATYIHENQGLTASKGMSLSDNWSNHLDSFRAAASYTYDHTYSMTAGYFGISGSTDAALFGGSPNSSGFVFDLSWLPWSNGNSPLWQGFNTRFGVQYTMYNEFDGTSAGASDNNTLFLYAWTAM
jgi:hypothetical protein